ncbi:MAG: potassium-transporting ATPase subunit F [Phycisphaerales bacterium]|nr:potassium-transporting ATPase subunit F [Phycisphaerales bacterium]
MNGLYWVAGVISAGVLVYLIGVLLYPEKLK